MDREDVPQIDAPESSKNEAHAELSDLPQVQSPTSGSRLRPKYDPWQIPANFSIARDHSVRPTQTAKKVANFQKMLEEDDENEENYCPCCNYPKQAQQFSLCCSITHLSELGEGFPLYYHLVKWVAYAFLLALLIAGIYCLDENYNEKRISEWDDTLDGNMILEGSLANFGRSESPSLTQAWLHVGCMWMFLLLHTYLLHRHKSMCESMDRGVITPSDYTCAITHLPKTLNLPHFIHFIEELSSGKVSKVNLAYDITDLMRTERNVNSLHSKKRKLERIQAIRGSLPSQSGCLACCSKNNTIESCEAGITQAEDLRAQLNAQTIDKFTGTAYVTFEQDESKYSAVAKIFNKARGKKKATGLRALLEAFFPCVMKSLVVEGNVYEGAVFKVKRAPEPEDIIWENLGV